MPQPIRIAIVGLGKIARDQHLPAIAANPAYKLVATASTSGGQAGVPGFASIDELVASGINVDAVSICTPPGPRPAIAITALSAGMDVFLEKPPAATLSEFEAIRTAAAANRRVLLASWHARFAPFVDEARRWAAGRTITSGRMSWRESVRKWHPGQDWLWQPGGNGVFDPGINGLSILTAVSPLPVAVRKAAFDVPDGAQTPIAATLTLVAGAAEIAVDLDFRAEGGETWEIELHASDGGRLLLAQGGAAISIDGETQRSEPEREYPNLYEHFAQLIARRDSDADASPLMLVADASLIASRSTVEAFRW
ncbi:MAG: Gfo/Idh/MocA family oxidoreductase [Sphingomonadaceae bacterium]|nr:Gfo/Idh/MocA family oxidoreductase [Sphingomonadaceae bacterium]